MSIIGNWLSIRFPKRMKFGKRLNVSGVVGLLIIPLIILLGDTAACGHRSWLLHPEIWSSNMLHWPCSSVLAVCAYLLSN